jgi:hypothetical protein
MKKSCFIGNTYGKMLLYVVGVLLAGFVGGMALSLLGLAISLSIPLKMELDPITITYILGYLLGLPLGAYWFNRLLYHRKSKLWLLTTLSLLGFIPTIAYFIFAGQNLDVMLFYFFFHFFPWLFSSFSGIIFFSRTKAQTPEKAE